MAAARRHKLSKSSRRNLTSMPGFPHPVLGSPLPRFGSFGGVSNATFSKQDRFWLEDICRFCLLLSDTVVVIFSLLTAYYVRFEVFPQVPSTEAFLRPASEMYLANYYPSIFAGASLQLTLLLLGGAYKTRTVLRFRRFFPQLAKSVVIWAFVFPGILLMLDLDKQASRIFLLVSFALQFTLLAISRLLFQRIALGLKLTAAFRQRILFVDWTDKTKKLAEAVMRDKWHPYELVGCAPPAEGEFAKAPPREIPVLGSYQEINTLCENGLVDIVILGDGQTTPQELMQLTRQCERTMVDFMTIPSGFQIFVSGLELTTVSGVPLLGVTKLPLDNPLNAASKRVLDVLGSIVGLLFGGPLVVIIGLLIYLESPGPIFFTQERIGKKGRKFKMIKMRSMTVDAPNDDQLHQSTLANDPRLLKLGKFIRHFNLDEIPQFLNVLLGDMSLVGPRPERTFHVDHLRREINSYNLRHNIIPGMTGWAQINGFRGDTDLSERIRCDIYYIENWNLILDLQIMLMTMFRWNGAH
jgi:Undecaprenyl-phosphate glucose phosphotransferase